MREAWKVVSIKDVCDIRPPKKEASQKLQPSDTVSFVPMENLGILSKDLNLSKEKPLNEVQGSYTYFAENDVLLAKITPCFENGKLGIARNLTNGVGFGSSEFVVLRSNESIQPDYLFYFLSQGSVRKNGAKVMTGAVGHKRVPKEFIEDHPIPLPPLPEQKQIVAILDEAFEDIATAVANAEDNLANACELFESYLNAFFTQMGEGWVEKKLGDICENLDSKRIPITKSKRQSGEIPYYGASGVVDHVADFIFDEDLLLVSEDGANLLARTYPIAFSISGKTWVNNHAHVLRFENMASQKFVEYYLNSISLGPYVSGMAQPKLNQKTLNSIPVPFPPLEQQAKTVESIEGIYTESMRLQAIYKQKLSALAELKQAILQKAFAGELTAKPKPAIRQGAVA